MAKVAMTMPFFRRGISLGGDGLKERVIYYEDELNDEFSTAVITPKKIDGKYVYCHGGLWKRITHFFWYRIVAMPLAFLYTKIKFHHRIVGAEKLKSVGRVGCFMYGNHTQIIGDPLIPNMINKSRDKYVIVHPNNVSIPVIGGITPSLGALPLPDGRAAGRNFTAAIEKRLSEGAAIVIYPEAHIWPYYTGIRPFTDASFYYPVKNGAPVFAFTNVYKKRRTSKHPKIVTYVDGPFKADESLSLPERRRRLRDEVYSAMRKRAALSDCEYVRYVKKGTELSPK